MGCPPLTARSMRVRTPHYLRRDWATALSSDPNLATDFSVASLHPSRLLATHFRELVERVPSGTYQRPLSNVMSSVHATRSNHSRARRSAPGLSFCPEASELRRRVHPRASVCSRIAHRRRVSRRRTAHGERADTVAHHICVRHPPGATVICPWCPGYASADR